MAQAATLDAQQLQAVIRLSVNTQVLVAQRCKVADFTGLANFAERVGVVCVLMSLAERSNMATSRDYIDLHPAMLKATAELI